MKDLEQTARFGSESAAEICIPKSQRRRALSPPARWLFAAVWALAACGAPDLSPTQGQGSHLSYQPNAAQNDDTGEGTSDKSGAADDGTSDGANDAAGRVDDTPERASVGDEEGASKTGEDGAETGDDGETGADVAESADDAPESGDDASESDSANPTPDSGDEVPVPGEIPSAADQGPVRTTVDTGLGLIVPSYLVLSDEQGWGDLSKAATTMAAGTGKYKDFWVAVNGDDSGPFKGDAWTLARTRMDSVRNNGGKLFGYVHAVKKAPEDHPEIDYIFRPVAEVEADVAAWFAGYPELEGIWIDEFYPRYEFAMAAPGSRVTWPNGKENGPTDKGYYNENMDFNGMQVIPDGGYFHTLTSWIKTNYQGRRIIGNAGGKLQSNEFNYAALVDVVCSFESTYKAESDATRLKRDVQIAATPQLALVHTTSADDMKSAIDKALDAGYSYIHTTTYPMPSVWNSLPSYFLEEVSYIASHP